MMVSLAIQIFLMICIIGIVWIGLFYWLTYNQPLRYDEVCEQKKSE